MVPLVCQYPNWLVVDTILTIASLLGVMFAVANTSTGRRNAVVVDLAQFQLVPAVDGTLVNLAVDAPGTVVVVDDAFILVSDSQISSTARRC